MAFINKNIIMKRVIAIIALAGFVSLGFTIIKSPAKKEVSKVQNLEKMDFSHKLDEKRLASWD